jgi:hypothetical protein
MLLADVVCYEKWGEFDAKGDWADFQKAIKTE